MRLDKFISQQLEISRAIAHREIRGQRVTAQVVGVAAVAEDDLPRFLVADAAVAPS